MDDLLPQLQATLRQVFGDDELTITRDSTANDIEGWDSMMHINVVIAVEKRFGVKFASAEINTLKDDGQNIGTFLDLLQRKLDKKR